MSVARLPFAVVWLAALVALVAVALIGGWSAAIHAWFAGWLIAISLPLGALPILMIARMVDLPETPTTTMLRLLTASLPGIAILVVPALVSLPLLFPWAPGSPVAPHGPAAEGFGKVWFHGGFFVARTILYLVIWSGLALAFARPDGDGAGRRGAAGVGLAGVGLGLHVVVGTLAAFDWWMSLDAPFVSSAYGALVTVSQATFALVVATAMALLADRDAAPERPMIVAMLVGLATAIFVQVSQFLVVWSANLPKEIVWYQSRWTGALGPVFVWLLPALLVAGFVVLGPVTLGGMRRLALPAVAALGAAALLDLACLACAHGTFTFGGLALAIVALVVVAGIGALAAAMVSSRRRWRPAHV